MAVGKRNDVWQMALIFTDIGRSSAIPDFTNKTIVQQFLQGHFNHRSADVRTFGEDVALRHLAKRCFHNGAYAIRLAHAGAFW